MALCALAACPVTFAAQDCDFDGKRVEPAHRAVTIQGKSGVLRCRDPASGLLVYEQAYENGRSVRSDTGLVRTFHPGGLLRRATFYAQRGQELAHAEFTEAGELQALACASRPVLAPAVDDKRLCGFETSAPQVALHTPDGRLRAHVSFAQGRLLSETTYDANGTAVRERRWDAAGRLVLDEQTVATGMPRPAASR